MLWTPTNDFQWTADNYSDNIVAATPGTSVTSGAAHTKGSDTEILSDASVTEDVYGMAIGFFSGSQSAAARQWLVDIKSDPIGGTTWGTIINNLMVCAPNQIPGIGYWYYFPLYAKSGTAFAAAAQCNNATTTIRVCIRLFGKPSRPDLCKVGSFVRSFGANTGTSAGTSITPGTAVLGSYTASLATTADDLWWWQGGLSTSDTNIGAAAIHTFDVACGDSTNKLLCLRDALFAMDGSERASKTAIGLNIPYKNIPSGANVYMRAQCLTTPETGYSCCVYGLGG